MCFLKSVDSSVSPPSALPDRIQFQVSGLAFLQQRLAARHERARDAAPPTSPWAPLGDIARTSVVCIAQAIGFAGLARRPGRELSLLEELQLGWERFRYRERLPWGRVGTGADRHQGLITAVCPTGIAVPTPAPAGIDHRR